MTQDCACLAIEQMGSIRALNKCCFLWLSSTKYHLESKDSCPSVGVHNADSFGVHGTSTGPLLQAAGFQGPTTAYDLHFNPLA
jgi:hypothetical protein